MSSEMVVAIVGAIVSVGLAFGPWMLNIHARVAVVQSKIDDIDRKMGGLCERDERRACAVHEARLASVEQRLERIEAGV